MNLPNKITVGRIILSIIILIILVIPWHALNVSWPTYNTFFGHALATPISLKYIIAGITGMLIYGQFQNIGMTYGIIPITGITLPFISYGGSSLISYMIILGIIINIERK